jgi:tetratricopeptide (TPR) repeat protein
MRYLAITIVAIYLVIIAINPDSSSADPTIENNDLEIEAALFTRTDFFDSKAIVPYPTAEARNRLSDLLKKYPDETAILLKISQLDEKLGDFEQSEIKLQRYTELERNSLKALETLASFYQRRAQFSKEAETLEKMIPVARPDERIDIVRRLFSLARSHELKRYLKPEFYKSLIDQDPTVFEIIDGYINKLVEEKNYTQAINILRQHKENFPDRKNLFVEKEASILISAGKLKEAEQVYVNSFDPFWPDELFTKFYEFLTENDRFKPYGNDLEEAFKRNPTDFNLAVRLLHYSKRAYEPSAGIFIELEKARAAKGISWSPEELTVASRILLINGYE